MSGSLREKMLLTIFPSLMIALVWGFWLRPTSRALSLRSVEQEKQATAPSESQLQLSAAQGDEARRVVAAEQARQAELVAQWQALGSEYGSSGDQALTLERIAAVFRTHQLIWLDSQRAGDSGAEQVDAKLKQLFTTLRGHPPRPATTVAIADDTRIDYSAPRNVASAATNPSAPPQQFWVIECAGSYEQVAEALRTLQAVAPQVLLVRIDMSPADPTLTLRRWSLVLAI